VMPEDPSVEYQFQGTISGYTSGGTGRNPAPPPLAILTDVIDKFPFASDTNATDVGDTTLSYSTASGGQSSQSHGYIAGGEASAPGTPPTAPTNSIQKFPFAVDTNATDSADLTESRRVGSGHSSSVNGYTAGGILPPAQTYNGTIDRFPFSADNNAVDVGDQSSQGGYSGGHSSATKGFQSGGYKQPARIDVIQSFPFATDTNAGDVGDLTVATSGIAGQSSETHGYASGGNAGGTISTNIQKFSFVTDGNSSLVSALTQSRMFVAGQSSTVSGYTSGGYFQPPQTPDINTIDKFPFASDTNATDVGDLTLGRHGQVGMQR